MSHLIVHLKVFFQVSFVVDQNQEFFPTRKSHFLSKWGWQELKDTKLVILIKSWCFDPCGDYYFQHSKWGKNSDIWFNFQIIISTPKILVFAQIQSVDNAA